MIGGKEPKGTVIQSDQTLCLINQRLGEPGGEISRTIIDALSCIALAEVCLCFQSFYIVIELSDEPFYKLYVETLTTRIFTYWAFKKWSMPEAGSQC
jgi:hypothetical protein